jgi:hypothetical protein
MGLTISNEDEPVASLNLKVQVIAFRIDDVAPRGDLPPAHIVFPPSPRGRHSEMASACTSSLLKAIT